MMKKRNRGISHGSVLGTMIDPEQHLPENVV